MESFDRTEGRGEMKCFGVFLLFFSLCNVQRSLMTDLIFSWSLGCWAFDEHCSSRLVTFHGDALSFETFLREKFCIFSVSKLPVSPPETSS